MRKGCFRNVKIRKILIRNVFLAVSAVIYSSPCCGYCCATLFTKIFKLPNCRAVSSTISLQCCSLLKSPATIHTLHLLFQHVVSSHLHLLPHLNKQSQHLLLFCKSDGNCSSNSAISSRN